MYKQEKFTPKKTSRKREKTIQKKQIFQAYKTACLYEK